MSAFRRSIAMGRLRTLRGLIAACVMVAYVLSGALHGICDIDVTNPAVKSEIVSAVGGKAGHSDQKGLADHHCHGCFSVAVPQPVISVTVGRIPASANAHRLEVIAGVVPSPESPPPKHLI